MKVSIVGIGRVGAALGIVLVARRSIEELVLVGRRRENAEAKAFDLLHATAFGSPTKVYAGDIQETAGSDVIVLSFGVRAAHPSRTACAYENYAILQRLLPGLAAASPDAVVNNRNQSCRRADDACHSIERSASAAGHRRGDVSEHDAAALHSQ